MRKSTAIVILSVATASAGSSTAILAQEPEEKAMASSAGITMTVTADRWVGTPRQLTEVIPLLVSIENNSSSPLRIRYQEFALGTPAGKWLNALPPFAIEGEEVRALRSPYAYPVNGFWVAPYLSPYYPFFPRFVGPFAYDPFFYDTYYPAIRRAPLPTGDMVQKVLPEGVLDPGGRITGFLYFETGDFDPDRGTFVADLIDAKTLRRLGRIEAVLEID